MPKKPIPDPVAAKAVEAAAAEQVAAEQAAAEQATADTKAAEAAAAEKAAADVAAAAKQAEVDQAAHDASVTEARAAMAQADADERAKLDANTFKAPEIIEVRVIGPDAGRWRITAAPRHFTPEPTFIPYADLTEADLMELQADTELRVTLITNGPVPTA